MIAQWFTEWVEAYVIRFSAFDRFDLDSEAAYGTFAVWLESFESMGATRDELDAAARMVQESPPPSRDGHLPALRDAVTRLRARKPLPPPPRPCRDMADALAREAELKARWDALPESHRVSIEAQVKRDHPGIAPFRPFVRALCLDAMERLPVQGELL